MADFDIAALSAEFPRNAVQWRAQSMTKDGSKAMALGYIDARDVMDRLDSVCGPANWQDRYEFHGSRTICYLSLRIGGEWVTKADGAGDSDVEAEKGAISDALKRAAVKWGIGRYLYALDTPWVPCETYESNGKKHWKRWTADPWSCVRGSAPVREMTPAEKNKPYWDARFAVRDAKTMDEAQDAFGAGWKATSDVALRAELKTEYEAVKLSLAPAPKNLGEHLDRLQAAEGVQ